MIIASYIEPILIVSGAATAGLIALSLAPKPVMRMVFGIEDPGHITLFLARYLGLLVTLVGLLLIYSALHPEIRTPVLYAAIVEKLFFCTAVSFGRVKRTPILVVAAVADACFAALYIIYLAGS